MAVDHLPPWFAVCLKRLRETAPDSMNEEQFRASVVWFRDAIKWAISKQDGPPRPSDLVTITEAAKQTGIPRRRIEWRADARQLSTWTDYPANEWTDHSLRSSVELVSLAEVRRMFADQIQARDTNIADALAFNRGEQAAE